MSLKDLKSGDAEKKAKVVESLGQAFEKIGFAIISDHGIDQQLIKKVYQKHKEFFQLPQDQKLKYFKSDLGGQRGYTPFGVEHAKDSGAPDLKEFFSWGPFEAPADLYPPNITVNEDPELNQLSAALYSQFQSEASSILSAISSYLSLPEDFFVDKIRNGNSILRSLHYPPILTPPNSSIRSAAHEDINLITLLVAASAEGLEVLNTAGEWIPVPIPESEDYSEIVINVGDMLQRLTNGKLVSTTHRVVLPYDQSRWVHPRYSMPFFTHPRPEISLRCVDSCVDEAHPRKYSDIAAGDYLVQRLREIGLIQ